MALNFPSNPVSGDLYTDGIRVWQFDGVKWNAVTAVAAVGPSGPSGPVGSTGPVGATGVAHATTSDTPPVSPVDGDFWWNSTNGNLYVYYDDGTSSQWVLTNVTGIGVPGEITTGAELVAAVAASPNMQLGPGLISVSTTINYPTGTPYGGGTMRGKGGELSAAFSARAEVSRSQVAWAGADGGTLMVIDGSLGLTFEQISFVGKASSGATDRAGIGHHWKMSGGFGSGESLYQQCTFQHFDTALKFGVNVLDGNCAGMHFIRCTAQNVDTFMHVANEQGLNYILDHCSFNFLDRVIYCERGGNIDMRNGNMAGCGTTNWCVELPNLGGNLWCNTFRNVRIEQNTKRFLKFVGSAEVVVDGFTEAQSNQSVTMFDQSGGKLTVRNGSLVTNNTTNPTFVVRNQLGGSPGILILENVHFSGITDFVFTDWVSRSDANFPAVVVIRSCTYGTGFKQVPDFCTSLEWGTVSTMGQTVGATVAILTMFAQTRGHKTVVKLTLDMAQIIEVDITGVDSTGVLQFSGRRLASAVNDSAVCTLIVTVIGADYNPLAITVVPAISVSDGFDCIEVTATGKTAYTINWTANFRTTSRNRLAP